MKSRELHEKWLEGLPSSEGLTMLHDVLKRPVFVSLSRVDFRCVGKHKGFTCDGFELSKAFEELEVRLRSVFAPWTARNIFHVTYVAN